VLVTVEYEGMDEPGPESLELTDALVITEAETTASEIVATPLVDSQVLAAAMKTSVEKPALTDSMAIVEANIRTGDRVVALTEALPLTENVGNSTTTELSEGDALVITESVDVDLSPAI